MRISDWSSDVCSSDLREGAALARLEGDILDAVHAEGRWRADDPRLHVEVEQLLAGIGGIGAEAAGAGALEDEVRSEEHTSELQSLMRISYAVFCLKKKNHSRTTTMTPS